MRHQTQPSSQLPSTCKAFRIPNRRHQGTGREGPNAGNCRELAAHGILPVPPLNLPLQCFHLPVQCLQMLPQSVQQFTERSGQFIFRVFQNRGNPLIDLFNP